MDSLTATPDYHSLSKNPLKETFILSASFLCVFTSFQAIQNLQSSLNPQENLGMISLACVYGSGFLMSIFTPALMYNAGIKQTIMMAWIVHCIYVMSNFFPHWATLIPSSIALGAVSSPLWTSVETYFSALSRVAVGQDNMRTTLHAAFSRLNGIFVAIYTGSHFTGNIISSLVLHQSSYDQNPLEEETACGVKFCFVDKHNDISPPKPHIFYILMSIFLACDIIGLIITAVFLPNLEQPRFTGRDVFGKLKAYWHSFKQPMMWLLVPLIASHSWNFSIQVGMFTEAYISCALGVRMVGYIMASWGLSTMVFSSLLGCAAKYTGRPPLVIFSLVVHTAILLAMLLWSPRGGHLIPFFCLMALMGLADGILHVQLSALVTVIFPAIVDSAFAVKDTWGNVVNSATFLMATRLCPLSQLYIAFGLLAVAFLCYIFVEILHRRHLLSFNRDDHEYNLLSYTEERDNEAVGDYNTSIAETANGLISTPVSSEPNRVDQGVKVLSKPKQETSLDRLLDNDSGSSEELF